MASFIAGTMVYLPSPSPLSFLSASSTTDLSLPIYCSTPCRPLLALSYPPSLASISCHALTSDSSSATKSDEYNRTMQRQMLNPYQYYHELGTVYLESMYMSSEIRKSKEGRNRQDKSDFIFLKFYTRTNSDLQEEGVSAILNLQQEKDIEYWGIDFNPIKKRCDELKIRYMKNPAVDFDPNSLRSALPKAVSLLDSAISEGKTVYVHCTAGLGRAPAVAIAYLFWFQGMNMESAYSFLTSKRSCGPRKEAIRGATYDLAKNDPWKEPFEQLPEHAFTDVADWERQLIQDRVRSLR